MCGVSLVLSIMYLAFIPRFCAIQIHSCLMLYPLGLLMSFNFSRLWQFAILSFLCEGNYSNLYVNACRHDRQTRNTSSLVCLLLLWLYSNGGTISYKALSQDEEALVCAAARLRMVFENKNGNILGKLWWYQGIHGSWAWGAAAACSKRVDTVPEIFINWSFVS